MAVSTITFNDLEHDHEELKRSASAGPVFVVEEQVPALVVLSFAAYERLRRIGPTPGEALSMPFDTPDEVLEFEFPKLSNDMSFKAVDFS